METYTFLRELADSWVLVAMFGFLIAAYIWAFLPSQKQAREDASLIPFRNEEAAKSPCNGACNDCAAKRLSEQLKGQPNV
ncbi:CcoQ/FixQ family Cbb3-type cytochrome c oxidase assembly chaperone [Sulfitobacter sp. SK012]|uniref:cbb3-type cytochrome c oxidase subunit 3 n=1 Tax=Sulfitobacter sp. SK012 TaxID=1389005 RepID=UPI000E0C1743|nr:cbb3-type cytochrome c oxidase subunit 3 [Sulfitobacter sp. SK012]AXI45232.1 CcoQ/FixQ family Cbb3-type cytochrome c oxidase assembly chaperone [Sulfitobacter sp. SK012]